MQLIPMLDRRSAACVLAMSGIYRRLLDRIEADPPAILERPRGARARSRRSPSRGGSLLGAGGGERRRRRRRRRRHRRRARLRRRGRVGDAGRGAPAARRRGVLDRARRAVARQRPARLPALLHRLPRAACEARQRAARRAPAASRDPGPRPGAARGLAAPQRRAPPAAPRPGAAALPPPLAARAHLAPAARRSRSDASAPTTRARSAPGSPSTGRARTRSRCCGT